MSLSDLDKWDPDAIHQVFAAATGHSEVTRQASQGLGQVMNSVPWDGEAYEAAQRASTGIQTDLKLQAQQLDAVANAAKAAETEVRGIKSDWQKICRMADRWGLTIDINTSEILPPSPPPTDPDDIAEVERRMDIVHDDIVELLGRDDNADRDLAAAGDGAAMQQGGSLTDQQRQRLTEATTLSPEQLDALQRGDLVLPPDQLGYLIGVSQSLGGKTPTQVAELMSKIGPDGGKLADALHLASNPYISSRVPGQGKPGSVGYMPERGGKFALPTGLTNAKVMDELFSPPGLPTGQPGGGMPHPQMPPMASQELSALANIAGQGSGALHMGSGLDALVLDKAHALVTASNHQALPMGPAGAELDRTIWAKNSVDPTLQHMLDAVHGDSLVVHDAATGAAVDGLSAAPGRGQQFLADMFNHDYTDGGKSVGGLFENIEGQAVVHDSNNATEVALAERAGQTAHSLAAQLADPKLLNLNAVGDSLGQMNPNLTQSLSHAMSHYIPDMMDNRLEDTRGFGLLDSRESVINGSMPETKNLFAVLNSDPTASGYINKAAEDYTKLWQHELSQTIADAGGDPTKIDWKDATKIGEMYGVRDHANLVEVNDRIHDGNAAAQAAWERKKSWIDGLDGIGSSVPVAGQYASTAAYALDQMFVGESPTDLPFQQGVPRASLPMQYAIAAELYNSGVGNTGQLGQYASPDGAGLQQYSDIVNTDAARNLENDVQAYLDSADFGDLDPLWTKYNEGYNNAK
ncbi:hypothetical protein BH09ACT8_BH09ACT8_15870 [soil metagenome]